jgi:hypothetical protein
MMKGFGFNLKNGLFFLCVLGELCVRPLLPVSNLRKSAQSAPALCSASARKHIIRVLLQFRSAHDL